VADAARVASRFLQSSSVWYDAYDYDGLLDSIPSDRYDDYDLLVHSAFLKTARSLVDYIEGNSRRTPDQILKGYIDALAKATKIPGTRKPLAYAKKHSLKPLQQAIAKLEKAETLRAEALATTKGLM